MYGLCGKKSYIIYVKYKIKIEKIMRRDIFY